VIVSGDSARQLQQKGDHLLERMDQDLSDGTSISGFVPAMFFPGESRTQQNLAAWKEFWNSDRIAAFKNEMERISVELGFTSDAFKPFYLTLLQYHFQSQGMKIPEKILRHDAHQQEF
jgi:hypothetical protein